MARGNIPAEGRKFSFPGKNPGPQIFFQNSNIARKLFAQIIQELQTKFELW